MAKRTPKEEWNAIRALVSEAMLFDYTITHTSIRIRELKAVIRLEKEKIAKLEREASSSCRGESSSSRYRGGGSLPEAKLKLENATRKLNRAEHDRARARISRTNAREEVGPRLRAFKSTPPITVLEDCDLMAITLMGYGPHSLLKFRLGVSARDQTTLNRLARFMGLNPEDGLQELTADRTFRLLPNSDTIELVPERR